MVDAPAAAGPKLCCVCDEPGGKHCTKCKSRHYCSKKCQLAQCKQLAGEFSDRLPDELMPQKKPKEEPPIVEDVLQADGSKTATRLSAVRATSVVKATALNGATPDWRGNCAI
ncbi:hypothetical protein M885DRAFT_566316 [Pelagophyceae sp. CCMP2097]|nr:hypothetical protein M885DRAFT_566316 [Pelagophyceae sp. CCMP2097]